MRSIKQFVKDLKNDICWAKIGLALDIADPWKRREMEDELDKRSITYVSHCSRLDNHYIFAITGGKIDKIMDFVSWFKTNDDWKYYIANHHLFGTEITFLVL